MIRITSERCGETWVVRVQGHLSEEDASVLEEACREVPPDFELDLADLRGLDSRGARAIRELVHRGARVTGASPYVKLRLKEDHP